MWFQQLSPPQDSGRSEPRLTQKGILKREESVPAHTRNWLSPREEAEAASEEPQLWADTVGGGDESKHIRVRSILEHPGATLKSSPQARAAPAPYVLSPQPQTLEEGQQADLRRPSVLPHKDMTTLISDSTPYQRNVRDLGSPEAIEMSMGPQTPLQNSSFFGALQGFGAAFGIPPLQGQTVMQELSSQQLQADGQRKVQGAAAAAARKVAMQTNSMKEDTAQPSGRSSPASMITLPASKTAKGTWPPWSPLSPVKPANKEPEYKAPMRSDFADEETVMMDRIVSADIADENIQHQDGLHPVYSAETKEDVHISPPQSSAGESAKLRAGQRRNPFAGTSTIAALQATSSFSNHSDRSTEPHRLTQSDLENVVSLNPNHLPNTISSSRSHQPRTEQWMPATGIPARSEAALIARVSSPSPAKRSVSPQHQLMESINILDRPLRPTCPSTPEPTQVAPMANMSSRLNAQRESNVTSLPEGSTSLRENSSAKTEPLLVSSNPSSSRSFSKTNAVNARTKSYVSTYGSSVMDWTSTPLGISTGAMPSRNGEAELPRADKAQKILRTLQDNLDTRNYPFFCADVIENQTEIHEDGKPPNARVSPAARCPCLLFSINGGKFFRDAGALLKPLEKVVCTISIGTQAVQTLAANLDDHGSWEMCTACVFSVDSTQIMLFRNDICSAPERKARSNVLAITCMILGAFGAKEVIGRVHFDLKTVLKLASQSPGGNSGELVAHVLDDFGKEVIVRDKHGNKQQACIYFNVEGYELASHASSSGNSWAPYNLEDLLKSVDEAALLDDTCLKSADSGGQTVSDSLDIAAGDRYSEDEEEDVGPEEMHRREQLEKIMDSLWMSMAVMILVFVDIILAIVFDIASNAEASPTPTGVVVVKGLILCGFVLELLLRFTAKGRRFWMSNWNVFDLIVICSSVVIFVVVQCMNGSGHEALGNAKTTTTALRVVSRIATALRIIRIMLNLRKAKRFDVNIKTRIRSVVSQNKRRYKKNGFDLDLTYITNRVIAMSAPAFGGHSAYRNDMHMVARFFVSQHYSRFFIFNLCDTFFSSDGVMGNYNAELLCGQCHRIPFEDHGPPLLTEILHFCTQTARWCTLNQSNVSAVHCKGGKGRTGVMIASFLLWTGHRRTAMDALELFSFRRTQNWDPALGFNYDEDSDDEKQRGSKRNQGVDGPSQVRYVHYMEAILHGQVDPYAMVSTFLADITVLVGPQQHLKPWYCSISVKCMRTLVLDTLDFSALYEWTGLPGTEFTFPVGLEVWGDVRIEIFRHTSLDPKSKRKLCMFCTFNTAFYAGKRRLVIKKNKVDIMHKDKTNKLTPADFTMTFYFQLSDSSSANAQQRLWFQSTCESIGIPTRYSKGDIIVADGDYNDNSLFYCVSGALEAVVKSDSQLKDHHLHGSYVPVGQEAVPDKVPCIGIRGKGTLTGAGRFFLGLSGIEYRARTEHVEGYHLPRSLAGGPLQANTLADIRVFGVNDDKLMDFYEVIARDAARQQLRTRTEVDRLLGLRALSARTAVLNSADEKLQLISSIAEQLRVPFHEKIHFVRKCLVKVSGYTASTKNHDWLEVRLVIMHDYIVFDYEIFGPIVSPHSLLICFDEVLEVEDPVKDKSSMLFRIRSKRATFELNILSEVHTLKALHLLRDMASRAASKLERLKHNAFAAPLIRPVLAAGRKTILYSGQRLDITAAFAYGFVQVYKGHYILRKQGKVVAELIDGDILGLAEFFLGYSLSGYSLEAHGNSSEFILISTEAVRKLQQRDSLAIAALYRAGAVQLLEETRVLMTRAFPGTWVKNQKVQDSTELKIKNVTVAPENLHHGLRDGLRRRLEEPVIPTLPAVNNGLTPIKI